MSDTRSSAAFPDSMGEGTATETDIPTRPVSYGQLRMLAECTLGLGNRSAVFAADDGALTWVLDPRETPPSTAVLVGAANEGKYPEIEGVTFDVQWTPPGGLPTVKGSVNAVQSGADALFWSESAVQKFVFPYFASCAGGEAATRLGQLQGAWNGYPTDAVAMFALMHLAPAANLPLSLDTQFALTYADTDAVQVVTLDGYEIPAVEVKPQPAEAALFQQAAPGEPYASYDTLRAMAEWAASLNDAAEYFVLTPGVDQVLPPRSEMPSVLLPGQVMVPTVTPSAPGVRLAPDNVFLRPAGGMPLPLDQADAVFWSTGSIQQFLLPYYASVRGFKAPTELQAIIDAWTLNVVSRGNAVSPGIEAGAEAEEVYGLVHLPRSSWMTAEELEAVFWSYLPDSLQDLLRGNYAAGVDRYSALRLVGVLHRSPLGTHVLPLGDFMVVHPQFFR
jgi:hypothetical protein